MHDWRDFIVAFIAAWLIAFIRNVPILYKNYTFHIKFRINEKNACLIISFQTTLQNYIFVAPRRVDSSHLQTIYRRTYKVYIFLRMESYIYVYVYNMYVCICICIYNIGINSYCFKKMYHRYRCTISCHRDLLFFHVHVHRGKSKVLTSL